MLSPLVSPDSGGISAFSSKPEKWGGDSTWMLQQPAPLVAGLTFIKDEGTHWLISPAREMTIESYKNDLMTLAPSALRYDTLPRPSDNAEEPSVLSARSTHPDRAARFVYEALASVVLTPVPVIDWDENDYEYLTVLTKALGDRTLPLNQLVWDPEDDNRAQWTRRGAFVAKAVSAFMAHERERVVGDEDEEADLRNDIAYLEQILRLRDAENPFYIPVPSPVV